MSLSVLAALERQNRLLKILLLVLLLVVVLVGTTAAVLPAGGNKAVFGEIDVGRINLVGRDGARSLVLAARGRVPDAVIDGKPVASAQPRMPGLFFYNDVGDEVGGLIYSGRVDSNGKPQGGVHLSMDRFAGDQQLALHHYEDNGFMETGLSVFDRGLHRDYDALYQRYLRAPEGADKQALLARWKAAGGQQVRRLFVGRTRGKSPALVLADPQGRPRIVLMVSEQGAPSLQFLDEQGELIQALPAAGAE